MTTYLPPYRALVRLFVIGLFTGFPNLIYAQPAEELPRLDAVFAGATEMGGEGQVSSSAPLACSPSISAPCQGNDPRLRLMKLCESNRPSPINDKCSFKGAGKTCGVYDPGGVAEAEDRCCDVKNGKCDCNTAIVNPCGSDPQKCLRCLLGAEARGSPGKDNACTRAIICTVLERKARSEYPNSICDVIAEGNGNQFAPFHCVCSTKDGTEGYQNDYYCRCCRDQLTDQEKTQLDSLLSWVDLSTATLANLNCPKPVPTHYLGPNDEPPNKDCTEVTVPGCTTEKFWYCPPKVPYIAKAAEALNRVADSVATPDELREAMEEVMTGYEALMAAP